MDRHNGIVLYHYSFSPYARRVIWYLALRGIDYAQCIQPPVLPRPDLSALGVKYRRIPVMAIGKDIYCDTRLILEKLEARFPNGALSASQPDQKAVEKLLERWCVEGGVFVRASQLIPPEMPLLKDPKFIKDREDFSGRSWDTSDVTKMRPEALAQIRSEFEFLETGLLADGREWILQTKKPSLADIEAIWPFHWLTDLKGALPSSLISASQFPKVFAWIDRFKKVIAESKQAASKPTTLKGPQALEFLTKAGYAEAEGAVEDDPLGLKKGMNIEIWPIDSGFRHHDSGKLLTLNSQEVVIRTRAEVAGEGVRLHYPRKGFRIRAVNTGEASKL